MNDGKNCILAIVFMLVATASLVAQSTERWTCLKVQNGLLDNYVECLLEDREGFLWIGTWSGISRFDGKSFVQYRKNISDSTSLPGNWIYTLLEDSSGNIWAGTDEGLARYNRRLNRFEAWPGIGRHAIVGLTSDGQGNIWAGGDNIVYRINTENPGKVFRKVVTAKGSDKVEIGAIAFDQHSSLWIGTSNSGLLQMDCKSNQINYLGSGSPWSVLSSYSIKSMKLDGTGDLIIGTLQGGLFQLTPGAIITLRNFSSNKENETGLATNRIRSLYQDAQKKWWILSPNGILHSWNIGENRFDRRYLMQQQSEQESLTWSCFLIDREGNEWVGTHGNGLMQHNRRKEQFRMMGSSERDNKIAAFLPLSSGKLLVGSDGNGLQVFDPVIGALQPINLGERFNKAKILDLQSGDNNEVWVSSWNDGFLCLDASTLVIKRRFVGTENILNFSNIDIKGICYDDTIVWVASNGEGVFQYHIPSKKFLNREFILPDLKLPKWGNSIFKDHLGRMWIATSKGVYLVQGKQMKHFNTSGANKISSNFVVSAFEDSRKQLWILTDGGLDLYNEASQQFETKVWSSLKLPQQLKAITEDLRGRFWLSTMDGIFCIDPQRKQSYRFASDASFHYRAAATLSSGYLVFGTLNGFVFFHPDSVLHFPKVSDVRFVDFQINYLTALPRDQNGEYTDIQATEWIVLDYSPNIITLKVNTIDLSNTQGIRYSYRLSGQQSSWIDLGEQNSVSFTNLSPGEYDLQVRATNIAGAHSGKDGRLHITVLPPWYRSNWAYVMYALMVILGLYAVYRFLLFRIHMKSKLALQEFKHQNELELYQSKINFFTNISHDIRTPLTLIMAPMQLLRSKISDNPGAVKMLDTMERNANSLLELTNELLDFRSLESGERRTNVGEVDLQALVKELVLDYENEARIKGVKLTTQVQECIAVLDVGLIKKMLNNLMGNAFKFVPPGGFVDVRLNVEGLIIHICVYNSGSIISDAVRDKLFDPFYSGEQAKGYGLGLAIAREVARIHKGDIECHNEKEGVVFLVQLPLNS